MTPAVTVVGSGASGVHFALTVLRKGGRVRMIDVGRTGAPPVLPEADLDGVKARLDDPARYFLGSGFEGVLLPGETGEYYGIPPSKGHVLTGPGEIGHVARDFAPLFSLGRGGLAEAWTAGCYPFTADEARAFPFPYADLAPHYAEVARRIGVTGEADDLARFMPVHEHLLPPLRLDPHSARLVDAYGRARQSLNRSGVYLGRTRVATLSRPLGDRQDCGYLGRCLWGCPREALYTPLVTLRECLAHPGFEYIDGVEVSHLEADAAGRVQAVAGRVAATGAAWRTPAERVALAAGALLSTRIMLQSIVRQTGRRVRLPGLMDNRQVLMPFLNPGMLGRPFPSASYQYHLLGLGLDADDPRDYVHAQITTLKAALVHPLVAKLPLPLSASLRLFRGVHAALGLVNVNLPDTRRADCVAELTGDDPPRLRLHYVPAADEPARMRSAVRRVRRALRALGCVAVPGMTHVRPMGASVHYAGTLPMTHDEAPHTTTPLGESRDLRNVYVVDGATFPFLPAKNITFTLMANAVRIAEGLS